MSKVQDRPVLLAWASEDGKQLAAWCPHCQRFHWHGRDNGLRAQHCSDDDPGGRSPWGGDYLLMEIGTISNAETDRIEEEAAAMAQRFQGYQDARERAGGERERFCANCGPLDEPGVHTMADCPRWREPMVQQPGADAVWYGGLHWVHCRGDRCVFGCDCPCHRPGVVMPERPVHTMDEVAAMVGEQIERRPDHGGGAPAPRSQSGGDR
jgi:hypothetical protein